MPLPPKAHARRPVAKTPVPVVRRERPPLRKPAPVPPSNAAALAALRADTRPPADRAAQDRVGNGAVAAGRQRPESDPKFARLKKDVQRKKKTVTTSHPPARAEAVAAQDAARPPKDDEEAQGKTANAEKMNDAKPKAFDKAAFIKAVEDAIAAKAPKNLDEADKFADSGKPEEVRNEVRGRVGDGKTDSAEQIATTTAAPPDTSGAVTKTVVPMALDRPPGTPAAPNPADAIPDKQPLSATDMSAGPAQLDQQMADAQVTEPQLQESNEPAFKQAVQEKHTAEQHSEVTPPALRQDEAAQLHAASATAKRQGTTAMHAMGSQRVRTGQQVGTGKSDAKTRDEDRRAQVTALLQGVFDTMKTEVEAILNGLDKKVDDQFTDGEKKARDWFTAEHKRRMEEYKDARYSGVIGKAKWVKDLFAGLPDEANKIFDDARAGYISRMREVISQVADTIGVELNRAKDRIAKGRNELQDAVGKLPADLRAIGKQAAAGFADQFDDLAQTVDDKATDLVDTLATKYTETLKSVDDEIAEEKAKNKGLIAKAADFLRNVINTIMELTRLLLAVLAKAGQAIKMIIAHPITFLSSLVSGVGGGLRLFKQNIRQHLEQGIMSWLLGRTAEAGLRLPDKFDARGILLMIAGLLGLTWPSIRARIARRVPEQAIAAAETALPLVAEVRKQGVAGMWEDLKARVGDLRKDLMDKVIGYVIPTIVEAGITWILSLLNPASAFVRAVKLIIDIIKFIVTQARQIFEFVNAVLDAVIAMARGATGGVPALIERALARSIPVLLGFLASLLGIGGIAAKVKQFVQALSRPVRTAIDWVIDKIVSLVKSLWSRIKPKRHTPKKPASPAKDTHHSKADRAKDMERALDNALREARALVRPHTPIDKIAARLPAIRRRYGLTGLAVVADRIQGTVQFVHFVAKINPTKDTHPQGMELSVEVIRADYGILVNNQEQFQRYADREQIIIEVRVTNPQSLRHLEHRKPKRRALYKPQDIKAKTLDTPDLLIRSRFRFRVREEHLGLVGFFRTLPKPEDLVVPPEKQRDAEQRLAERDKERQKYGSRMADLRRGPKGPGRYEVKGYVVYGYDLMGRLRPIAGDHDLFSVRDASGRDLDPGVLAELIERMKRGDFGVMHGTIREWDLDDPRSGATREENAAAQRSLTAKAHKEGVVRFTPGRPPTAHYPPEPE